MISCGLSAIAYLRAGESARLAILLMWVLIYVALILAVRLVERLSKGRMPSDPEIMNRVQKIEVV